MRSKSTINARGKARTRAKPPTSAKPASADPNASPSKQDYDTPWKIALENYFMLFMEFFFPEAHAQIDWSISHQFLSKELKKIAKDAVVGPRHVDELVKVTLLSGKEDWICIHVEVQVSRDAYFETRMLTYSYRIFDFYGRPVASFAVLGDDDPGWHPTQIGYSVLGSEVVMRFPVVKLLHFADQEAELETNPNPFALLTLAYLQNRATKNNMQARYAVKCKLIRLLRARDWEKQMIREFFKIIDWMMELPEELANKLSDFVVELEEKEKMEYVTTVERHIRAKERQEGRLEGKQEGWEGGKQEGWEGGRQEGWEGGKQEGKQEGASEMLLHLLTRLLTRRFGDLPQWVHEKARTASKEQIEFWFDRGTDAKSLDDVFRDLPH